MSCRLKLTPDGAGLHARLTPLLDAIGSAVASMPVGGQPKALLRLTAPPDIGATFLAEAATRFAAQHPSVSMDVRITSRRVDIVAEGFDVAIRAASERLPDSALVARTLMPIEFHVFGSPSYLAFRGTPRTPSDGAKHDRVELRGWKRVKEVAPRTLPQRTRRLGRHRPQEGACPSSPIPTCRRGPK